MSTDAKIRSMSAEQLERFIDQKLNFSTRWEPLPPKDDLPEDEASSVKARQNNPWLWCDIKVTGFTTMLGRKFVHSETLSWCCYASEESFRNSHVCTALIRRVRRAMIKEIAAAVIDSSNVIASMGAFFEADEKARLSRFEAEESARLSPAKETP